ncbi:TonB-dependent receptor [Kordiimonas marina]|uniref:TonB-dependent receptor n=1 Tax=Kordiimonas marina TaxID=2872312 RepID=UPI001FF2F12E|nr:TonB-dependent receptor [Kordiimonas marina]MCJ9430444.1 TonB-dependent receptor [Kordiimonas marina]
MTSTELLKRRLAAGTASMLVATMSIIAAPAWAQDAPTTDNQAKPVECGDGEVLNTKGKCESDRSVEEVVVTGSHLRRNAMTAPSPLTVVGQQDIKLSGKVNLGDFLAQTPALQESFQSGDSTGSQIGLGGLNFLNLRGLGSDRTLVLVDGRRHVGLSAGDTRVDINTIPSALVERVEVVTGGASALYGSDAVSGVVNFIMKHDYEGYQVDGYFGKGQSGIDTSRKITALAGWNFGGDRGNATLAVEWRKEDGVDESQFDWLGNFSNVRVDRDVDANGDGIADPDGIYNIVPFRDARSLQVSDGGVLQDLFFGYMPYRLNFDTVGGATRLRCPSGRISTSGNTCDGGNGFPTERFVTSLTPDYEAINVNGSFDYKLTDNHTFFVDAKYAHSKSYYQFQPNFDFLYIGDQALEDNGIIGVDIGLDNPFLPQAAKDYINTIGDATGYPIAAMVRFNFEFGARPQTDYRDTYRIVGGLRGNVTNNWTYEVSVNYGKSTDNRIDGGVRKEDDWFERIDVTTDANGNPVCRSGRPDCDPINVFGPNAITQAQVDSLVVELNNNDEISQLVIGGSVNGDLFDMPAGAVQAAFGVEYREDRSVSNPDPLPTTMNLFANELKGVNGQINVKEIYGEMSFPLLEDKAFAKDLSVDLAGRLSDYSTAGSNFTYKAGLNWTLSEDIRFRATYGRAVRAPNIGEVFQPESQTFGSISDPCSYDNLDNDATVAANRRANCAALGLDVGTFFDPTQAASKPGYLRGNPDVGPETADTITIGTVLTPRFLKGFSLSADYWNIKIKDAIRTLSASETAQKCVDGPDLDPLFCDRITRDPSSGLITSFILQPVNVQAIETDGIDIEARYGFNVDSIMKDKPGRIDLRLVGTYTFHQRFFNFQNDPTDFEEWAGVVGTPHWASQLFLSYTTEKLHVQWKTRWLDPMLNARQDILAAEPERYKPGYEKSGHYFKHDLSVEYKLTEMLTLRLGVNNVFDKKPPIMHRTSTARTRYDLYGRYYWGGLNVKF